VAWSNFSQDGTSGLRKVARSPALSSRAQQAWMCEGIGHRAVHRDRTLAPLIDIKADALQPSFGAGLAAGRV